MANASTLESFSGVRARIYSDNRVSLSDFARSKGWRSKLAKNDFMELQEHGDRVAWIISEKGMRTVFEYISKLEEQVELASIRAMFDVREGNEDWKSGADLERGALAHFHAHEAEFLKMANSD